MILLSLLALLVDCSSIISSGGWAAASPHRGMMFTGQECMKWRSVQPFFLSYFTFAAVPYAHLIKTGLDI